MQCVCVVCVVCCVCCVRAWAPDTAWQLVLSRVRARPRRRKGPPSRHAGGPRVAALPPHPPHGQRPQPAVPGPGVGLCRRHSGTRRRRRPRPPQPPQLRQGQEEAQETGRPLGRPPPGRHRQREEQEEVEAVRQGRQRRRWRHRHTWLRR